MSEPHALHAGIANGYTLPIDSHNSLHGKTCARCGYPITDGARYCRECGQWARRVLRPSIRAAIGRVLVHRAWLELTR